MNFNSFAFFLFFAVFFAIYHALGRRGQNVWLLAGSSFFYASWDVRFLLLLVLTTVVDYSVGRALAGSDRKRTRKLLILTSLVFNIGVLGFFKYFNFFQAEACRLAALLGMHLSPVALQVALPVGISFYTFKSMSYTIDVYRRTMTATNRLLDYAIYISFFPQLLAGPIERASVFLPQIGQDKRLTWEQFRVGSFEICWGLVLKVFAADNLALMVNNLLNEPRATGFSYLLTGYAFTFQILGDFAGYSYLSNGFARLLGFQTMRNFNLPYFAKNPREFWLRWHISLSAWLRDYLYIPLGGNRCGPWRRRFNLMVTMVLGGLWHGANLTYVAWGAYHGFLLVMHRLLPVREKSPRGMSRVPAAVISAMKLLFFFHCVVIGWLIFRADSLHQVGEIFRAIFGYWQPDWASHWETIQKLAFYIIPILVIEGIQHHRKDLLVVLRLPVLIQVGVYVALFYLIVVFGFYGAQDFFYTRF